MNDSLLGLNDTFLTLYRENVLPVFRYHLVRSGDWQEAQALTRETFRRAFPWFTQSQRNDGQTQAWLFSIAVWVQLHARRKLDVTEGSVDGILPHQEQVAAFVKAADISEMWSKLPVRTADALALFIFADLNLIDTAQVVGWSLLDLQTRLSHLVEDQVPQRLLAGSLQPVGFFIAQLEAELREMAQAHGGLQRRGAGPAFWRLSYRSGQVLGTSGRFVPLAFFVILLVAAVWFLSNPAGVQPEVQPTATVPANLPASQFPWTSDSAILADAQGRIYRYELSGQTNRQLSPQGFYQPLANDGGPQPQISPDGKWLEIVSTQDMSTWLLALDGSEERNIIDQPVQLSWARGSERALYVDPRQPMNLNVYSVAENSNSLLVVMPGPILASAIAPDGMHAAVLFQQPTLANAPAENALVLINNIYTGDWKMLARLQDPSALGSRHKLIWTEDSREIWYPRYHAAVRLADFELHPLVSKPPYDPTARPTFLNLLLHPSVAQPFLDRFGLEALLLDEADTHNNLLTLGAVSPDHSKVALAYYNALGVTGSLTVQQGSMLEDRAWSANFGTIGAIAWTAEGHELLVAEKENRPGRLWWVLARTGQRLEIDLDVVLLGTFSSLQARSLNHAPQITLAPSPVTPQSQGSQEVVHPGMGIRFDVPADWNVWSFAEDRLWGSVEAANFNLEGPFGFASLGPEQLLVMVSPVAWQDQQPLADWLEQLAQRSGGMARYSPATLDGLQAYRLEYTLPDQSVERMVLVETERGVIGISMIPGNSNLVDEFEQILNSMHFEQIHTP